MNIKNLITHYDINSSCPPGRIVFSHDSDVNTRTVEVIFRQDAIPLAISTECTAKAAFVERYTNILINDNVPCTVTDSGHVLIPVDSLHRQGKFDMNIELTVTNQDGEQVIATPFPMWITVNGSILNKAEVTEESKGTVPELLEEAAEALAHNKDYDALDNRPQINGHVLTGDQTAEDLGIETGGSDDYNDLNNKPTINGITLSGNKSDSDLGLQGRLTPENGIYILSGNRIGLDNYYGYLKWLANGNLDNPGIYALNSLGYFDAQTWGASLPENADCYVASLAPTPTSYMVQVAFAIASKKTYIRTSTNQDVQKTWGAFQRIGWTQAEIEAMIGSLVDPTLSVQGKAADALVVGERIHENDRRLSVLLENHEATYIPKNGTHAGTVLPMNGRISLSGAYEATAFSSSSDFIPVTPLLTIVPHCYGHQSFLSVAFYNANKEFISGVGVQASWERVPQDIDIPAGAAYYRLCEMVADSSGYIDVSYVTRESTKELAAHKAAEDAEFAQVNSRIEDVEQALIASSHVAVADVTGQSGFVDANGVFNSSASWVVTDYMSTKTLLSLTEHVRVYSGRPNVVFYDKYKVFISANVPDTSAVIDAEIVPPDNAYYFRLNFFVGDPSQYYDLTIDKLAASAIETANKCDPLFGKKIGAVGDSITIGTYSVPGNTYVNQIANAHGMTVNNAAVWGSIFPTGKTENDAPRGSIFSQIATLDNDCDIIIISGGINDAEYYSDDTYWGQVSGGYEAELDPATFCGAFEGTLKTALNKFPGKPIIFVFEHRITQPYQSIYGQHFENIQLPLMLEMLKKWGIPYVDLFHETPSIKYTPGYIVLYSVDNKGVHPNIAGYRKFYTPHVESAIQAIAK